MGMGIRSTVYRDAEGKRPAESNNDTCQYLFTATSLDGVC
jgi:hypothetical protein